MNHGTTTLKSNTSNGSSNDDSIASLSFFSSFNSSISTKLSLLGDSTDNKNMTAMSRIQRRKQKAPATDRLSVTLHTSDSDFNKQQNRRRPEFDRQKSMSRWMADTLSTKCGEIRRSLSSHESLLALGKRSSNRGGAGHDKPKKNASFRFFSKADSSRSMSKPVRRPSEGSEGLIKDVLAALSIHDSLQRGSNGTAIVDIGEPDDLDIEEDSDDDSDDEEQEFGGSGEGGSGDFRWESSSPERKEEDSPSGEGSPPSKELDQKSNSRRSSKTMPFHPPPPPFTPIKKPTEKLNVAPLAAAAIAIATDGMEQEIDDEEGFLNDMNNSIQIQHFEKLPDAMNDSITLRHNQMTAKRRNSNISDHTDNAMAGSVCTWNDSISTDGVSLVSASNASIQNWTTRSIHSELGFALECLNEEDSVNKSKISSKDFSYKSSADDTSESAYTFAHDAQESPATPAKPQIVTRIKSATDHPRPSLTPLVEPPLTPLRDQAKAPPAMPRRSRSNHNDNIADVPMASPADRLKCLLNHGEKKVGGRRSSMPSGCSDFQDGSDHSNTMSRRQRRATMDNSSHHGTESRLRRLSVDNNSTHHNQSARRRRASLDNTDHSNSMRRRRASLDNTDHTGSSHSNSSNSKSMRERRRTAMDNSSHREGTESRLRRLSLGNTSTHQNHSVRRRRASMDSATGSPSTRSVSRKSIPSAPHLGSRSFDCDDDDSHRLRNHEKFLDLTVSQTVRASPAVVSHRKRPRQQRRRCSTGSYSNRDYSDKSIPSDPRF